MVKRNTRVRHRAAGVTGVRVLDKGGILWTPAELSTDVTSWLDSSDASTFSLTGSLVDAWNDKSGNSNHFVKGTGSEPTYSATGLNGVSPAVIFSASKYLSSSFTVDDPMSIFAVARKDSGSSYQRLFSTDSTGMYFGSLDGSFLVMSSSNGTTWNSLLPVTPASSLTNLCVIDSVNNGSGTISPYFNGNLGTAPSGGLTFSRTNPRLGAITTTGQSWLGLICEFLYFNTAVDDETRLKLEGYLAHKWGTQVSLVSTHLYRDHPPYL